MAHASHSSLADAPGTGEVSMAKKEASDAEMAEVDVVDTPIGTPDEVRRIKWKVDLRVTLILALMYIANQLDRGNVAYA